MHKYREHEIKILDVNVSALQEKLEALGAKKVFDGERILTTFDATDKKFSQEKKVIRMTEEEKVKLSINYCDKENQKHAIKVFTSRKDETTDFLAQIGIHPIARVTARRISYEWNDVDFDIDIFPEIPAFLEIDTEHLGMNIDELLSKLDLLGNKKVNCGTEEIFSLYGKNYYTLFAIRE